MTDESTHIVLFKGKEVRRTIHDNEWWFSVSDVIELLTDSKDVRQYVKRMRSRDPDLNANWGTICTPLRLETAGGPQKLNWPYLEER